MAVRSFDLAESRSQRLTVVAPAPRRHDLRRAKQRAGFLSVISLAIPFGLALVLIGVFR